MLMKTLGASRQAIHHYFNGPERLIATRDRRQREFWKKLDQVFTLLLALTDKKDRPRAIREWLHSPNKALEMRRSEPS
jgi:hypothetical protein